MPASTFPIPFPTDRLLVGGAWRAAAGGATLALEDPSDGARARPHRAAAAPPTSTRRSRRRAPRSTATSGGGLSAVERGRVLAKIGRKVLEKVELLAELEVHDVGKPLKQARADAVALARYCEFYAGAGDKVHGETLPFANGYTALTLREPHGVTGHIVPGTTRCRSSAAASARRSRWATPACSSRPRKPA